MKTIISIAIGGSLGAIARFYLSKAVLVLFTTTFPWGTLAVNLIGSLLIGIFFNLFNKIIIPIEMHSLLTIGFLGAFTTFSTFAVENFNLLRNGAVKSVLFNIFLSNFLGILLACLGFYIIELLFLTRR